MTSVADLFTAIGRDIKGVLSRLGALDGGQAVTGTRSSSTVLWGDGWRALPPDSADDPNAVKLTGAQSIAGVKTFTNAAVFTAGATLPDNSLTTAKVSGLQASLDEKVASNDTRLTDSRTPTAHAASHAAGGPDALAISGSQLTGDVAAARLGTGTADATTILYGDRTWRALPAASGVQYTSQSPNAGQRWQARANIDSPELDRAAPRTFEDYTLSADCAASTAVPTGLTGTFALIFEDNFGGSTLGRAWLPHRMTPQLVSELPFNSDEKQAYKASQVVVTGGSLELRAVAGATTASDGWGGSVAKSYKSGMVQSARAFTAQNGVFEARIKIPADVGYWPAFWLADPHQEYNAAEIDLVEWFENGGSLRPHTFAHWGDWRSPTAPGQTGAMWSTPASGTAWHTYTVEWSRPAGGTGTGRLTAYMDGVQGYTVDNWDIPNEPLALILNLAVRANGTPPDDVMLVDYVRVWKRFPDPSPMSDSDARRVAISRATADAIADATATGKDLLRSADAAAARTAIGAGTSSLALGSTSMTAAAGNHTHTADGITDATVTGKALIRAADAAAARTALAVPVNTTTITAGTGLTGGGNLTANRTLTVAYGTTSTTATVGNDARVVGAVRADTAQTWTDPQKTQARANIGAATVVQMTLAAYNALGTKDANTLYVIVG